MSKLTDIQQKILQLEGGAFQKLCDVYLSQKGYKEVFELGLKSGTNKTTIGNPDTYFVEKDGKYIFVMYTSQQSNIDSKIEDDISKCLDETNIGIKASNISQIIHCHTSSTITPQKDNEFKEKCSKLGIELIIYGIDNIAMDIYNYYPFIARDFLGISIDTDQVFNVENFINRYDSKSLAAPLNINFMYREKEKADIYNILENNSVILISGNAGVGKTKLCLECGKDYSNNNDYKFFCITSNKLSIYDDLKTFLNIPGKYLLLVDDANQITNLNHILDYITKGYEGYDVKILMTVREYAKNNVINDIRKYTLPEIYNLKPMDEDEIKSILKNNLGINNDIFLKQIIKISECNTRIAILAGYLAIKTNSLQSIQDATSLYEAYYSNFLKDNSILNNRNYCLVLGVISFLDIINLDNLNEIEEFLNKYSISIQEFTRVAYELSDLELVDIYYDKAIKISDQCFGNYILKYVLYDKNILSLSFLIEYFFIKHKDSIIQTINILLNIFTSEDLYNFVEREVLIVWKKIKNNDSSTFRQFFKMFFKFNPNETLELLLEQINDIENENISVEEIDTSEKNNYVSDDILTILGGFYDSEHLYEAIELLIIYYKKRPSLYIQMVSLIKQYLTISPYSYKDDYRNINILIELLIKNIADPVVKFLFVNISKSLLKINFQPVESSRGMKIILYRVSLLMQEGTKKYRSNIWNTLLEIYNNNEYVLEIESIIKSYGNEYGESVQIEIIKYDFEYIKEFLKIFSTDNLRHCIIAQSLQKQANRNNIDIGKIIKPFFETKKFKMYFILTNDSFEYKQNYEERLEKRNKDIYKLSDDFKESDIEMFIEICKDISINKENLWNISSGVDEFFKRLVLKEDIYVKTIREYLANDIQLDISIENCINNLFKTIGIEKTKKLVYSINSNEKNKWLYFFYISIPEEEINISYLTELYDFLQVDDSNIIQSFYRNIYLFYKYKCVEEDVIYIISRIILKKFEYSPFMANIYLNRLFNNNNLSVENLFELYEKDFGLLIDIYFAVINYNRHEDYNGKYLIEFIKKDYTVLYRYLEYINRNINDLSDYCISRLNNCWKLDNYKEIFNTVLDSLHSDNQFINWTLQRRLCIIFTDNKDLKSIKQDFLKSYIDKYNDNLVVMKFIFSVISELPDEYRKDLILYFIKINSDYEFFSQLRLEPNHWGGTGSLLPVFEKRKEFFEILYAEIRGVKFIKHKNLITKKIDNWQKRIDNEKIDELMEKRNYN